MLQYVLVSRSSEDKNVYIVGTTLPMTSDIIFLIKSYKNHTFGKLSEFLCLTFYNTVEGILFFKILAFNENDTISLFLYYYFSLCFYCIIVRADMSHLTLNYARKLTTAAGVQNAM